MGRLTLFQISLVIAVLAFTFFLVYSPHFDYKYPLHIDEWKHISAATALKEGSYELGRETEPGFHFFLLVLNYLGFNLIFHYKFLPAIFAVLTSLALFFFIYKLTKRFHIALFSMIFFASVKSNVNILGNWFFVPVTFALLFMLLFFYLFLEGFDKKNQNYLYFSSLILLLILAIHATTALFALSITLIYMIINHKKIKENIKGICSLLGTLILVFIVSLIILKGTFISKINFLINSAFIFRYGWTPAEIIFNPLLFYGIIPFILALSGAFFMHKNGKTRRNFRRKFLVSQKLREFFKTPALRQEIHRFWHPKIRDGQTPHFSVECSSNFMIFRKNRFFIVWCMVPLILVLMSYLFKFTIIAPYQRLFFYFMISLVPLSAYGLYGVLMALNKVKFHLPIQLIIIIIVIFFSFQGYYITEKNTELYQIIDDKDYEAISFLKNFEKSNVLSDVQYILAIHPVSGHNAIGATGFFVRDTAEKRDVVKFFKSDCDTKKGIILNYNINLILSKNRIDCNFLHEEYNKKIYIYKAST